MDSWTICPECGAGKGQDHRRGCERSKRTIRVVGRGTPCSEIMALPCRPLEPDAAHWRAIAAAGQAAFEVEG
jgi:hypothetical protein